MADAKFDPIGRARAQRRLLDLIPEPVGPAYDDAARAALVRAGVSEETIAILEEAARQRPTAYRPPKS